MKKCLIIGGGIAGLTSAVYLSKAGIQVEIIEASPKLGGRAYSFKDNITGTVIDNGQHILMGCYIETLKFIKLIKAEDNLIYQKKLFINFLKPHFRIFQLKSFPLFYPLNLMLGLLRYNAVKFSERIMILSLLIKIPFYSAKKLRDLSVNDWLIKEHQNENIRKAFWDIIAVGTLNCNTKDASAVVFVHILKKIFFGGNSAAKIILPAYGLTETFCNHAEKFIEDYDGIISFSENVISLKYDNDLITELVSSKRNVSDFDYIISSVPIKELEKFSAGILQLKTNFIYSPIISIHIWLTDNILEKSFYALIGSKVHWIFNHGTHLTLVISDANELINMSSENIFSVVINEIEFYTPLKKETVSHYKVIKEKRATFIPSLFIQNERPDSKTRFKNFYLAGDWINTGLPSTIESAVLSGKIAANEIISLINQEIS